MSHPRRRSGERRTFIEIYRKTKQSTNEGDLQSTLSKVCERWARVVNTAGSETQQGEAMAFVSGITVETDYIDGLDPTHKVRVNGEDYDISGIDDVDGYGKTHVFAATRVS